MAIGPVLLRVVHLLKHGRHRCVLKLCTGPNSGILRGGVVPRLLVEIVHAQKKQPPAIESLGCGWALAANQGNRLLL